MENTNEQIDFSGKPAIINKDATHPLVPDFGGSEIRIEGRWDSPSIGGKSWMFSEGNPACMIYGVRSGFAGLPIDNNVWYGRIGGAGHLVHGSEVSLPSEVQS